MLKNKLGYNNSYCINMHQVLVIVLLIVNHFTTVQKHALANLRMFRSVVLTCNMTCIPKILTDFLNHIM